MSALFIALEDFLAGIQNIYNSESINVDLYMVLQQKLYMMVKKEAISTVDNTCISSQFAWVCKAVYSRVIDFLKSHVNQKYEINYVIKTNEEYLLYYTKESERYKRSSYVLSNIFTPIQFYWINNIEQHVKRKPFDMFDIAMTIWNNSVLQHSFVHLNNAVFGLLLVDRTGDYVDKKFLHDVVLTYTSTNGDEKEPNESLIVQYRKAFIKELVNKTREFYNELAAKYIEKYSLFEYMIYAQRRIKEEQDRIEAMQLPSKWNLTMQVVEVCEDSLLGHHFDIISNGLVEMLKNDNFEQLETVYLILKEFSFHSDAAIIVKEYIIGEGLKAIRECEKNNPDDYDAVKYADAIDVVLTKYENVIKKYFSTERKMYLAVVNASKKFYNPNVFEMAKCKKPNSISFEQYQRKLQETHNLNDRIKYKKGG